MKSVVMNKLCVLSFACLFLTIASCRKKEESCWECFSKPKAECQGMGKCKWEPKITIDMTWSNTTTAAYQVNDNGRCMCEQDNVVTPEKSTVNVASLPFYAFNNVSAIVADRNNNVWVTHDATTEYFNGTTWSTNNITPYDNTAQHTVPYNSVNTSSMGYCVTAGNYVFAATSAYGIASLNANPESNAWSYYQTINSSIPTQNLNDVYAESDNRLWIASKDYGIIKFDLPNTWTAFNSSNTTIHSANVNCITADHSGNIWFGTDNGFGKLENATVKEYFVGAVHDIACDNEGNIWAATDDGCKRWNTSSNTMEYYGTETSGLNSSTILSLTTDHNNKLWIGTTGGLYAWENGKIVKYTPANEYQVGTVIKSICSDQNNKLWIATDKGVAMLTQ